MAHLSGNATWTNTSATPVTLTQLENIEAQIDAVCVWTGSRWLPSDHGLIAWTNDPMESTALGFPLSGGLFHHSAIKMGTTATCTGAAVNVRTAGASMTSGQSKIVLYNSAGTQLAVTADQSASWDSTGGKQVPWVTPFTLTPGTYYACVVANSTGTAVQMSATGLTTNPMAAIQFGRTSTTARMGTSTGVTTTIPTTRPTPSNLSVPSLWVGLY